MANTPKIMKSNLSELSIEALTKQRNLLKGVGIGFGILLFLALCIMLYIAALKKNFALISVFPASMITLIPIFMRVGQIEKEIKSRQVK